MIDSVSPKVKEGQFNPPCAITTIDVFLDWNIKSVVGNEYIEQEV